MTSATTRRRALVCAVVVSAACLYACSLLVPFDDYPGPPVTTDAALDVVDAGDEDVADAGCGDADTKADPNNCGACGRICAGGGACDGGRCPIEEIVNDPAIGTIEHIALGAFDGGTFVYFTATDAGLGRALVGGAGYELAQLPPALDPGALSIDVNQTHGALVHDDTIEAFDPDTFGDAAPKAVVGSRADAGAIIVRGARVYWSEPSGMWSAKLAGAPGLTGPADAGRPIAFDLTLTSDVEWFGEDTIIWRLNGVAEPVTDPIPNAAGSIDFVQANGKTYFTVKTSPTYVVRIDTSNVGPPDAQLLGNTGVDGPRRVVASPTSVYVLDKDGTRARRMDYGGRALFTLVDRLTASHALAIDGTYVYLADGPRLVRTSK